MSQENVELWREHIEYEFRGSLNELDPEATVSKMAELWDPEIECRIRRCRRRTCEGLSGKNPRCQSSLTAAPQAEYGPPGRRKGLGDL